MDLLITHALLRLNCLSWCILNLKLLIVRLLLRVDRRTVKGRSGYIHDGVTCVKKQWGFWKAGGC